MKYTRWFSFATTLLLPGLLGAPALRSQSCTDTSQVTAVEYRIVCTPIRGGQERTVRVQARLTAVPGVTSAWVDAMSFVVLLSGESLITLDEATVLPGILPGTADPSDTDLVPENRVYLAGGDQILAVSIVQAISQSVEVATNTWLDVADIPVAVDLNAAPGDYTLTVRALESRPGVFEGESTRKSQAVVRCFSGGLFTTRGLDASTDAPSVCSVADPLFRVEWGPVRLSCDGPCPSDAATIQNVDLLWVIRDWKGFLTNSGPDDHLKLIRRWVECADHEGCRFEDLVPGAGDNSGAARAINDCIHGECRWDAARCLQYGPEHVARAQRTLQQISEDAERSCNADGHIGDPACQRLQRAGSSAADLEAEALRHIRTIFCARPVSRVGSFPSDDSRACDLIEAVGGQERMVHTLLVGPNDGRQDMYFWIRDDATRELDFNRLGVPGQAVVCYEVEFRERTNDDRDPFACRRSAVENVLVRRLEVNRTSAVVGGRRYDNELNYYLDINDVVASGGSFTVHGSGFGSTTKIGISVKAVSLIEPCCCDDDQNRNQRVAAGRPKELNWTYIFDGGTQWDMFGDNLFTRSDTRLIDGTAVTVVVPGGEIDNLLAARPPCVGSFVAKVFVVEREGPCDTIESRYQFEESAACGITLPFFAPDPQPSFACVSNRIPFLYGFGRPDFDYFRSGRDNTVQLFDALAILFFLFGQYERPPDEPVCRDAADTNDNGLLDLADAVRAIHDVFGTPGIASSAPRFPDVGSDPNGDSLNCGFTADPLQTSADPFACEDARD